MPRPPSTGITAPVMYPASGEARNGIGLSYPVRTTNRPSTERVMRPSDVATPLAVTVAALPEKYLKAFRNVVSKRT